MGAHIGIIGAGQVGAAAGFLLSSMPGISDIVLVDVDAQRAEGEAADIAHAAAFGATARITEGGYADLAEAEVVVITAGASLEPGQNRLQLIEKNLQILQDLLPQVLKAAPQAVLLFAANPVDVMTAVAVQHFGVPRERAIGTGCTLDAIRFRDALAQHLEVTPTSIHANVLGEHGDSSVLHWSQASIGGIPVLEFASQWGRPIDAALQAQMAQTVRTAAYQIKAVKGVSNFGIGGGIARLVKALVDDERSVHPVSTFMPQLLGVANTCVSLPHVLGSRGASQPLLPPLSAQERAALRHSADTVAQAIAQGLQGLS